MTQNSSTGPVESDIELEKLRTLILGEKYKKITDSVRHDARDIVRDVVTEAIHDREHRDGSVKNVLQPMVEDSVQRSVANNSERLINSLYPIVGSLVRKSVSAFLAEFMEKTNQLLENSLTLKGLKWRISAWKAGVSFAQYAASQTFIYRVEHVFLIHKETGILLKSVALNSDNASDADLISSMLTAINDFVGDSFLSQDDALKEQLQSVHTDNFNLVIKPGPNALLVAAVTGNPPQYMSDQLQLTLENIQQLYFDELNQFNGDNTCFDNAESLLHDCLLSEQKSKTKAHQKKPWLAIGILFIFILLLGYQAVIKFEESKLHDTIMTLHKQPGIIVKQLTIKSMNDVELEILRDPDAITVKTWFDEHQLNIAHINISEKNYLSLDPPLLYFRAKSIIRKYPTIKVSWENNVLSLHGTLDIIQKEQLVNALELSGFVEGKNLITQHLILPSPIQSISDKEGKKYIFNQIIGRVAAIQLNFPIKSATISSDMKVTLLHVSELIKQLALIAQDLDIKFGFLIIGSSDNSGNQLTNNQLSLQRAENTEKALINLGLNKEIMYTKGIGEVKIKAVEDTARKVMFNVLYVHK